MNPLPVADLDGNITNKNGKMGEPPKNVKNSLM